MTFAPHVPRALRIAAVLALAACDTPTRPVDAVPTLESAPSVADPTLLASSAHVGAGERVVIALAAPREPAEAGAAEPTPDDRGGADSGPVAFSGVLEWEAAGLAWVGQIPEEGRAALVGTPDASRGRIAFAGYADSFEGNLALFVLEGSAEGTEVRVHTRFLFATPSGPRVVDLHEPAVAAALPDGAEARSLSLDDWMQLVAPEVQAGGPLRVPGEGFVFGDATVDGIIDARDALYVANMAVSNTLFAECMLNTDVVRRDCIAANVAPANAPGLGEPTDPCPPGLEVCGGFDRVIDARDVLIVRREAVGIDEPVGGELIPRPATVGDTVALGSFNGTRTLHADTIYRLSGIVTVGTDGATGPAGELVIPPGVRIIAESDAALVVTRNGRIRADGTAFQPITFDCAGAAIAGCWRGIRIHGNARVNRGTPGASPATARSAGGCTEATGGPGEGPYGGCADADSSGVFRFVRVLHAGASGAGVELRGVGSGTVIRQLYVTRSAGDGVAVLGGTTPLREVRVQLPANRGFRWDEGWRGTLQWMAVQAGANTQGAIEGSSSEVAGATPVSEPEIRNVTIVASPDAATGDDFSGGIRLRGGTRGRLSSLLVLGRPHPDAYMIDIDGADTWSHATTGALVLDSSLVAGYGKLGEQDADPTGIGMLYSTDADGQYLRQAHLGNRLVHEFALLDSIMRGPFATVPDLRPMPNAVVSSTTCGTGAPPFDPAPYCGALPSPDATLGAIPWLEPAPLAGTVGAALTPTPGYGVIVVLGARPGQPQFPLPGVSIASGVTGATDVTGRYRAYVATDPSGGGANGFVITVGNLPPGCSNPGPIVNLGPPSGQEQVYGVLVPCT